ncbi:MAG: rhodanese-like domain-containing protein [Chloroflexota bacterium]|nr:rhodanese-like domain-containing protein [Chloroflexota bacterium]
MALVLEQIYTEGIAQLSYVVGDDAQGVVAVIDPRRDVEVYLELARRRGVRIAHIVETHIHADFASGSRELQAKTGATIHGGRSDAYEFPVEPSLGSVTLRTLHTPGHTPEHVSLLVSDAAQGPEPFGIFTGDTLFNLDAGRPDLVGGGTERYLAARLYRTLFEKLVPLGDRIEVYPGHGAGSACGTAIGDRRMTTIGNERLFSPALKQRTEEEFVGWILGSLPEPPRHYARLKKLNARGMPVLGDVPTLPPLSTSEFREKMAQEGTVAIDARSILAFGGGHVPGALNIALRAEFPNWVGWMVEHERTILLVVEGERDAQAAAEHLFRLGYGRVAGYLHDGMTSWQNAGLPLERVGEWTVHDLDANRQEPGVTVLDVRSDSEWEGGRVPGARHVYVPHLEERLGELDPEATVAVYCGSGYRASIAASVLQKHGFGRIVNVPGSWTAWKSVGLPVEHP